MVFHQFTKVIKTQSSVVHSFPVLKYFAFSSCQGDLKVEEKVLDWLIHQVESDEIEDVTDEMLDMLIKRSKHLAVLFCKPLKLLQIS